jgi:hypothetical protein
MHLPHCEDRVWQCVARVLLACSHTQASLATTPLVSSSLCFLDPCHATISGQCCRIDRVGVGCVRSALIGLCHTPVPGTRSLHQPVP